LATQAQAGNTPGKVTLSIAESYYRFADNWHYKNRAVPNFGLAYNLTERVAVEASFGIINTVNTQDDQNIHGISYYLDGIYRFAKWGPVEPYVLGGLGLTAVNHNGNNTKHPGNINGGLGAQLFWGEMVALRLEGRDIYNMTGSGRNDVMILGGINFLFGG